MPMRQVPVHRHPVAKAVAISRMQRMLLSERIAVLMLADGELVVDTLAHLAWMIGVGCETAVHALGLQHPTSRRLHGALRTIETMCLRGDYRWDVRQALAIEAARVAAHQVLIDHPTIAQQHISAGDVIAGLISRQKLVPGVVAGAELYAEAPARQD